MADGPGTRQRRVPPPSREELERVRARDPEALGRFFDRYFDAVYGMAVRLLGDRSVAEDVAQDAMVKAHRSIDRLDPGRDPGPWLTTIVVNVVRDRWRSATDRMDRQSASIEDREDVGQPLPDGGPDPAQRLLAREREEIVQAALMQLPDAAREVIVLHDVEGLSHDRVAEVLGASHAAIRKRYSRALQALGEILRETMDR